VTREEMQLMQDLQRICDQAQGIALHFADNGLPLDTEIRFATQLLELGEGILRHATSRNVLVVDADAAGDAGRSASPQRALPSSADARDDPCPPWNG